MDFRESYGKKIMAKTENKPLNQGDLAGIQYLGIAGVTAQCLEGITRLIHFGDSIHHARLVTSEENHHGFILTINHDEQIAIKSGFASGYTGTGAHGLSTAIQMLLQHNVEIDEYNVSSEFMERLNRSCLLRSDLEQLEEQRAVKPDRYTDYIIGVDFAAKRHLYDNTLLRSTFPAAIPFHIIDDRIMDLALDFPDNPDFCIISAFRRLEDIIRERTDLKDESGETLFARAFHGPESILCWEGHKNEQKSKANMFVGIFGTYRNPRAHREQNAKDGEYLREFLLLNELFLIERDATKRPPVEEEKVAAA